jgi:hypothetical protein
MFLARATCGCPVPGNHRKIPLKTNVFTRDHSPFTPLLAYKIARICLVPSIGCHATTFVRRPFDPANFSREPVRNNQRTDIVFRFHAAPIVDLRQRDPTQLRVIANYDAERFGGLPNSSYARNAEYLFESLKFHDRFCLRYAFGFPSYSRYEGVTRQFDELQQAHHWLGE